MSERGGWTIPSLPEAHLLPDAVVAFVDGELSAAAHERAAAHIARCPVCAADTTVQRQARDAVQAAEAPRMPAGLMAALRAIPTDTDLPDDVERLAVTPDGQLVTVQRPDRAGAGAFGSGPVLGASRPLGTGSSVLRTGATHGRRAVQGAGVVAAGLMLGALAMVGPHVLGASGQHPAESPHDNNSTANDQRVVQAGFNSPFGGAATHDQVHAPAASTSRHAAKLVEAH
ncbi:MAG TPA: zf-HC2 domain-containing protein [Pseudonocardiaceae bacterium]|nr:zf-HC2 domain-containing protein [Pseudonocardiaceae bacterium]